MNVLDLFSGIGGFSLGLERTGGFKTVAFCEIDPFCRKVLAKHWPGVPIHEDVRGLTADAIGPVDLICGGFPCQPFSGAGPARGKSDPRYLWPEMFRVISGAKPRWVCCENVTRIDGMALEAVCSDLEAENYEVAPPLEIPAASIGAEHFRYRTWILAHTNGTGLEGLHETRRRVDLQPVEKDIPRHIRKATPRVLRRIDGFSTRLDRPPNYRDRIKALGNAVVPQVVEMIGRAILEAEAASWLSTR